MNQILQFLTNKELKNKVKINKNNMTFSKFSDKMTSAIAMAAGGAFIAGNIANIFYLQLIVVILIGIVGFNSTK